MTNSPKNKSERHCVYFISLMVKTALTKISRGIFIWPHMRIMEHMFLFHIAMACQFHCITHPHCCCRLSDMAVPSMLNPNQRSGQPILKTHRMAQSNFISMFIRPTFCNLMFHRVIPAMSQGISVEIKIQIYFNYLSICNLIKIIS